MWLLHETHALSSCVSSTKCEHGITTPCKRIKRVVPTTWHEVLIMRGCMIGRVDYWLSGLAIDWMTVHVCELRQNLTLHLHVYLRLISWIVTMTMTMTMNFVWADGQANGDPRDLQVSFDMWWHTRNARPMLCLHASNCTQMHALDVDK